jgi:putative PIN family toxin of toxin-antitoxin system
VRPQRIVIDTNVLVSMLLFAGGQWDWLRLEIAARRAQPLASGETVRELMRVLSYPKFDLGAEDIARLLEDYLPYCEIIDVKGVSSALPRCRDPDDLKFLRLARAGKADALITGDKDLLALANAFAIPILSPADFRRQLAKQN